LRARLFDRTPQGVTTTPHGASLQRHVLAVFDELKQGIKDIEFLSDPTVGEVRIGCPESISAAILQPICETFCQQHPRVALEVDTVNTLSFAQKLRDRSLDVVFARGGWPIEDERLVTDFNVETLYDDELVIAVGTHSPWARRRKIDLAELRNESWILTSGDRLNYQVIADAFRIKGVDMPRVAIKTISVHLRANMVATGRYVATFPRSVLDFHSDRFGLKMLPVDLPNSSWPVKVATLRHRSMSAVVKRFIACAQTIAKAANGASRFRQSS
jgi:DNA-binding transcriptional LysR family regulator